MGAERQRIHVVEDDREIRMALRELLTQRGYAVAESAHGADALTAIQECPPHLIVTDLDMPVLDGMGLLRQLRTEGCQLPVLVLTSDSSLTSAVEAMRVGADDYLTKPVDIDALVISIERALERRRLVADNEAMRQQLRERTQEGLGGLLGASSAMLGVYRFARQVAPSRATVLITGESGTGKGELARAIHALSPRAARPFVAVHCAALSETLLESELFGHEKGAFTGAEKRRTGRFEQADGGTLFLDEIGEISPATQVKLLTFLQERRFERVGGSETVAVDVRIIAATNRNLAEEVEARRFREDLYYRLNVVHLEMPPLRARGGDAILLAEHFLRRFAADNGKHLEGFTEQAKLRIRHHRWSGNVRALENAVERAVVLAEQPFIDAADLALEHQALDPLEGLQIPGSTMAEVERYVIEKTLESVDGSTSRAAEILDLGIRTIQYRLHQYGLAKNKRDGNG